MVVTTALSTIVVSARLYARGYLIRELGWEDYTIVIAQVRPFSNISGTKLMVVVGRLARHGAVAHGRSLWLRPTPRGTYGPPKKHGSYVQKACRCSDNVLFEPLALSRLRFVFLFTSQPNATVSVIPTHLICVCDCCICFTGTCHYTSMYSAPGPVGPYGERQMHGLHSCLSLNFSTHDCL